MSEENKIYEEKQREMSQWKCSLSCYRDIVSLKFEIDKDNFTALERLCGELRGLPYTAPAERTIIIPREAQDEFSDLSYEIQKASWASDV